MNDEFRARLDKVHPDLMSIITAFQHRYEEPHIGDNIYKAVMDCIKGQDPGLENEIYPDIIIRQAKDGYKIQIVYNRIH